MEGRPIPFSSSVLMRLASVYRGGGEVKCCSPSVFTFLTISPFFRDGSSWISSPSAFFSLADCMTVNPSKRTLLPVAFSTHRPLPKRAVVVCCFCGAIWLAIKRFQISVYSLICSRVSTDSSASGGKRRLVGRMASWASWAFFDFANIFGFGGRYSTPYTDSI